MIKQILYLTLAVVFLFSCKNDDDTPTVDTATLELTPTSPPFSFTTEANFYSDIAYGDYERNTFDFFAPTTEFNTPLVIFIHGGGFTGGDKTVHYNEVEFSNLANALLSQNIAVASINYRFINDNDTEGVLKSLNDSKRALQFIKYHANNLNINKNKILLIGSSAGAGTSLWIGLSDDMALDNSSDPILLESTRVQGIVGLSTQSSYDVVEWHNSTFYEYQSEGLDFEAILNLAGEQTLLNFYGINNLSELNSPEIQAIRVRLDMLGLLSSDDPEILVSNADVPYTYPENNADLLHHPLHAKTILDNATQNNVVCKAYIPQMGIDNTNGESILEFIIRKIGD